MKLDVSKVLTEIDGITPLIIPSVDNKNVLTVKKALNRILSANESQSGEESIHVLTLNQNIFKVEKDIELTPEDVVLLKGIVDKTKVWTDLVKGTLCKLLKELK